MDRLPPPPAALKRGLFSLGSAAVVDVPSVIEDTDDVLA